MPLFSSSELSCKEMLDRIPDGKGGCITFTSEAKKNNLIGVLFTKFESQPFAFHLCCVAFIILPFKRGSIIHVYDFGFSSNENGTIEGVMRV